MAKKRHAPGPRRASCSASNEASAAALGREHSLACSGHPARPAPATTSGLAAACRCHRCCHGVYVIDPAELAAAINHARLVVSRREPRGTPARLARRRQQLAGAASGPRRAAGAGSPPRSARSWCLELGMEPAGGARPQSGPPPCSRWPKVLAGWDQLLLLFLSIILSAPQVRIPSSMAYCAAGATAGERPRRHTHPHPGAQRPARI